MFSKSTIRTFVLGCLAAATAAAALIPNAAFAGPNDGPGKTPPPTRGTCPEYNYENARAPYVVKYGLSGDDLQKDFYGDGDVPNDGSYNDEGFRPVRLTGYTDNGSTRFATKWVETGGPA